MLMIRLARFGAKKKPFYRPEQSIAEGAHEKARIRVVAKVTCCSIPLMA